MYRRRLLASCGLPVAGLTAGCLGGSAGDLPVVHRETGGDPSGDPSSWNEIHVDIVTLGHHDPDGPAVDGVSRGLAQLAETLDDWFGGYVLRVRDTTTSLTCRDEQVPQFDELVADEDRDRQYHFVHSCNQFLSRSGCNSCRRRGAVPWGAVRDDRRAVSSISAYNKLYLPDRYRVRAFHNLLHTFVTGETARAAAGLPDTVSDYDAEHRLGTIGPDGHRTVMADRFAYRHDAAAHGACTSDRSALRSDWPDIDELGFSTCTRTALRLTAETHGR